MKGKNRRWDSQWRRLTLDERTKEARVCVFISHRSSDGDAAKAIAEALADVGIDYYLDSVDIPTQIASASNNDEALVLALEAGLDRSSHLLAVVSNACRESWWVPWEVGSARAREMQCALQLLEDVKDLPAYLRIVPALLDVIDLRSWITKLSGFRYLTEDRARLDGFVADRAQGHLASVRGSVTYR